MEVEFDRLKCAGWFQCVQHWDAFEMNTIQGKADLNDSAETDLGVFRRSVPQSEEEDVKQAVENCPVDAIIIYNDDGDVITP